MASLHPAATIARIDGRWPSLLPSCSKTGGEIERLGAGAYRGSRGRLRHSISAVGPKIPYTKKRPLGPVLLPADKRHHLDAQALFRRRRHQPRRPPLAKIRPGRPAPAMGPGTLCKLRNPILVAMVELKSPKLTSPNAAGPTMMS